MKVPFDQLPVTARVWIYPANRSFSEDEIVEIKEKAEVFLEQWTAHGAHLQAGIDIPYDRFIVLGLNESAQSASGCSIDASVHFIQSLEERFKVTLLDKMNVTFRKIDSAIAHMSLIDFRKQAKKKLLDAKVIVFNNLVLNKNEYQTQWEVPAAESWHSRYF